jgi:DNA polymerase epsilon subunit 3
VAVTDPLRNRPLQHTQTQTCFVVLVRGGVVIGPPFQQRRLQAAKSRITKPDAPQRVHLLLFGVSDVLLTLLVLVAGIHRTCLRQFTGDFDRMTVGWSTTVGNTASPTSPNTCQPARFWWENVNNNKFRLRLLSIMAEKLEDLNLPNLTVQKIIKDALPDNVNVGKDARSALSRAASIFVLYITSQATKEAQKVNRKTLLGLDIIKALEELEFDEFVEPLQIMLKGE